MPHLPRKSSLRCSKRRTRHVKLSQPRRQTSADLWRCSSTAPDAPATQAGPEVLQALRLKTQRRQCVPCRRQASADLYGGAPRLHLPHRTQRRQCAPPGVARLPLTSMDECCTCHANRASVAPSAASDVVRLGLM